MQRDIEILKEKSRIKNVSFSSLLSEYVQQTFLMELSKSKFDMETLVYGRIASEKQCKVILSLDNGVFSEGDIARWLKSDFSQHGWEVQAKSADGIVEANINLGEMYIPLIIKVLKSNAETLPVIKTIRYIINGDEISYRAYPTEEILADNIADILTKMELINDMDRFLSAYEIIGECTIEGRSFKEMLSEKLSCHPLYDSQLNTLKSYGSYSYMKKKWKAFLRGQKIKEPAFDEVIERITGFLEELWNPLIRDEVFFGDWMPQLRKFI